MKVAPFAFFAPIVAIAGCVPDVHRAVGPASYDVVTIECTGSDLDRGNALRTSIDTATAGSVIELCVGTHELSPKAYEPNISDAVWITQTGLTIQGQGPGSVVKLQRPVYIGFVIRSGVQNLTIRNLTIAGSLTPSEAPSRNRDCTPQFNVCFSGPGGPNPNTHGIGTYTGTTGVSNVLISGLLARDLAVGINVGAENDSGACTEGAIRNVTIANSTVVTMYGRDGGSGYGIATGCSENVLIIDNLTKNTGRHAIYHGKTAASTPLSNVRVIRNTIVDHGHVYNVFADANRSAITYARGQNGSIVNNAVIVSHQQGISVEVDPVEPGFKTNNNYIVGNHFIQPSGISADNIWIKTDPGDSTIVWANTLNSRPVTQEPGAGASEYVESGIRKEPVCWDYGAGTQWIEFWGSAPEDVGSAGNLAPGAYLYVMQNNGLHRVDPNGRWGTNPPGPGCEDAWPYVYSTTDWSYGDGFQGMAQMGGKIYVMQHNTLHKVTPQDVTGPWPYSYSTTWWAPSFSSMATMGNGEVYVIQNQTLHSVTPDDSNYAWDYNPILGISSSSAMRAAQGVIYVHRGSYVSMYNASYSFLGNIF